MELLYGVVIWSCYMELLYGVVIWSCYMELLYGIIIWGDVGDKKLKNEELDKSI